MKGLFSYGEPHHFAQIQKDTLPFTVLQLRARPDLDEDKRAEHKGREHRRQRWAQAGLSCLQKVREVPSHPAATARRQPNSGPALLS